MTCCHAHTPRLRGAPQAADGVIEIPCFGSKNSLNVCSAASIVIFEALRQWGSLQEDQAE